MRRAPPLLIFFALTARADVSTPPAGGAFRCQMSDSPYWSQSRLREAPPPAVGRDLQLRQATARHVLYSRPTGTPTTLVLERFGPRSWSVAGAFDGFVEDPRGELVALLGFGQQHLALYSLDGKLRWRRPMALIGDSAAAIADGGHLYLAQFHRIATGSQLMSLRLSDGAFEWNADVQPLNVDHSKYFNDVELTLDVNILTMIGREAGGCYQQQFVASDGKRLSSSIVK